MYIEFNYDISDCDAEELGKEIFADFNSNDIGICINAIFTDANFESTFTQNILQNISSEAKDALRKALSVEEKKEEKEEVFYEVGDRFKQKNGIYRLSLLGMFENNMAALVKVERIAGFDIGYIWKSTDYSVKDIDNITQEEFSRIAYGDDSCFTLIKEETT